MYLIAHREVFSFCLRCHPTLLRASLSSFTTLKNTKIEVIVKGVPNQLFLAVMQPIHQWEEARKFFAAWSKCDPTTAAVIKDLCISYMSIGKYLTDKYTL